MKGFSIVVCAYNPDVNVLRRLLTGISALKIPAGYGSEIIIVDNNSDPQVSENEDVKKLINENLVDRKIVVEKKQGLTNARIRGFNESRYEWIVFFDDDNVPNEEYIINLGVAIDSYPEVGCWGPADISVELIDTPQDAWIQSQKLYFQERHWKATKFGLVNIWQDHYPYGTGLVVHKEVMTEYIRRIVEGRYTLSDRKGKGLTSGGDLQIVLTSVNIGRPVGTALGLAVDHLILPGKANINYLVRQIYGTSSSYLAAHAQADPALSFEGDTFSDLDVLRKLVFLLRSNIFKAGANKTKLLLAQAMGDFNARLVLKKDLEKPTALRMYEKYIGA